MTSSKIGHDKASDCLRMLNSFVWFALYAKLDEWETLAARVRKEARRLQREGATET